MGSTLRVERGGRRDPTTVGEFHPGRRDRKSTRLNSSHGYISYAVFWLKKKRSRYSILAIYQLTSEALKHGFWIRFLRCTFPATGIKTLHATLSICMSMIGYIAGFRMR